MRLSYEDLSDIQIEDIKRVLKYADTENYIARELGNSFEVFTDIDSLVSWVYDGEHDDVHDILHSLLLKNLEDISVQYQYESKPLVYNYLELYDIDNAVVFNY